MPTVEELDRLNAIIKQLAPLAAAHTGQLIRAEDWNTAIGALQTVARALVADSAAPVAPHEHPDQVAVGWLDPRLRQLVEQGPAGDPAALARVAALERGAEKLQDTLNALQAELDDMRTRSRDIATRDLDRESAVNVVRRKLEGVADAREDVAQVRTSLAVVQERITRAVELAENLQDGGEPVDLGGVKRRVDELAKLRDGLTLPSGEVLDAQAFERKLAELRNELVTQNDLDTAVGDVTPELTPDREKALKDGLAQDLKADLDKRDDAVRGQVAALVDTRLAAVPEQVDKAVASARPGIIDAVLAESRKDLDTRAPAILTAAKEDADTRVKAIAATLRQEAAALAAGLRAELPGLVGAELDARLPQRLAALGERLEKIAKTVDGLVGDLKNAVERLAGTEARLDELTRSTDERFDKAAEQLKTVVGRAEAKLVARISALEERVKRIEGQLGVLDTQLGPRVENLLNVRDARLRDELAGIAGDQVAGVEDRLGVMVDEQVTRAEDERLRMIAAEAVEERLGPR